MQCICIAIHTRLHRDRHSLLKVINKTKQNHNAKKTKEKHNRKETKCTMNKDDHGPQTSLCIFGNEI